MPEDHWERPDRCRVLACANQKGGVGKSTTAVNVGAWLALEGARVLLVDLDPQSNATTGVGVNPREVDGNIYQVLLDGKAAEDAIEPTATRNLYCIPSTIDLAGAEIELVPAYAREQKLKNAIAPLLEEFDYVFIDCPPSLGLLTVNALVAARELLVPIQCEYYALEGLGQLLKNLELVRTSLNPDLALTGIVLTMFDPRTKLSSQVADEVVKHFPGQVFPTVVPRSVRLSEAPSYGQPVATYAPRSSGALAYRGVAFELAHPGRRLEEAAPAEEMANPALDAGPEQDPQGPDVVVGHEAEPRAYDTHDRAEEIGGRPEAGSENGSRPSESAPQPSSAGYRDRRSESQRERLARGWALALDPLGTPTIAPAEEDEGFHASAPERAQSEDEEGADDVE